MYNRYQWIQWDNQFLHHHPRNLHRESMGWRGSNESLQLLENRASVYGTPHANCRCHFPCRRIEGHRKSRLIPKDLFPNTIE